MLINVRLDARKTAYGSSLSISLNPLKEGGLIELRRVLL